MDQFLVIALVALGLPLVSFVLIIFNQRALGERAHLIAMPIMAFDLALVLYMAWIRLKTGAALPAQEWSADWLHLGSVPGFGPLTIPMSILIDNITVIMMVVVVGVSFLVQMFSIAYMRRDVRYSRYFAFLGLFTFAMLGVVLSSNLLLLYTCWELVGFSSWALISHWYERPAPQIAGNKAFLTNRVGDTFFFIGILLLFSQFHTFNIREIFGFVSQGLPISFSLLGLSPETSLTVAGILIFGGAVAKSAQFPLFTWLPHAMEGPTPVSALIHAATMVAAGVYLMARLFPMLTADAMLVVACTGAFTSVMAATIAISQTDIKRVLAYSTVSQLGLMMMSIGAGAVNAGLFHLVTHAAFKASLFLGAGSVINATHHALHEAQDTDTDAQDIRNLGGLRRKMPWTAYTFLIATLAISGLPLMAGMLSKDEILSGAMAFGELQGGVAQAIPVIGFVVTLLTAAYMFRVTFLTFFGLPSRQDLFEHIRESRKVMIVPLVLLSVCCLWIPYAVNPFNANTGRFLAKWVKTPAQVIPPQTAPPYHAISNYSYENESFGYSVAPVEPNAVNLPMPHQVALLRKAAEREQLAIWLAMGCSVVGFLAAFSMYFLRAARRAGAPKLAVFRPFYAISQHGWYIDQVYDYAIVGTTLLTARITAWSDEHLIDGAVNASAAGTVLIARIIGYFDRFVVDGVVKLLGASVQFLGLMARSLQTGRIQTYLAWVVASVIVIFAVAWYVLSPQP